MLGPSVCAAVLLLLSAAVAVLCCLLSYYARCYWCCCCGCWAWFSPLIHSNESSGTVLFAHCACQISSAMCSPNRDVQTQMVPGYNVMLHGTLGCYATCSGQLGAAAAAAYTSPANAAQPPLRQCFEYYKGKFRSQAMCVWCVCVWYVWCSPPAAAAAPLYATLRPQVPDQSERQHWQQCCVQQHRGGGVFLCGFGV